MSEITQELIRKLNGRLRNFPSFEMIVRTDEKILVYIHNRKEEQFIRNTINNVDDQFEYDFVISGPMELQ